MSELDDAFGRVASASYRINNLFQRRDDEWQANVIGPDGKAMEYGVAHSPAAALHMAMAHAAKHELAWWALTQAMAEAHAAMRRLNAVMEGQHEPG